MKTAEASLWKSGYRPECTGGDKCPLVKVHKPDKTAFYTIDIEEHTCDCMGFSGHKHCKHVSGLSQLLIDQMAEYARQRLDLTPIKISEDERLLLHMGGKPENILLHPELGIWNRLNAYEDLEWQLIACLARLAGNREIYMPKKFVGLTEEENK